MRPGGNTSSNSSVSTARWVWLLDQVFLFGQLGVEPGDVADRVGVQVAETRTVTSSSSRAMSSSSREDACRRSGPLNEALSSSSGSGQRASAVDTDSEFGRVLQRVVNGAVVAGADQGVYVDLAQFGRRVVDDVDMADPSGSIGHLPGQVDRDVREMYAVALCILQHRRQHARTQAGQEGLRGLVAAIAHSDYHGTVVHCECERAGLPRCDLVLVRYECAPSSCR